VAERALYYWSNDYIMSLVGDNPHVLFPIILPALLRNSKQHWNKTILGLIYNALKIFAEMNQKLFDECKDKFEEELEQEAKILKNREDAWTAIEKLALQSPHVNKLSSPQKAFHKSMLPNLGSIPSEDLKSLPSSEEVKQSDLAVQPSSDPSSSGKVQKLVRRKSFLPIDSDTAQALQQYKPHADMGVPNES
jgi:serine/threonine-protein phosphatase 2A regulatory subunit B'